MRTFWVLVKKELRELLTWQILGPFAVVVVLFVSVGGVVGRAGEEAGKTPVTVIDHDSSEYSAIIVSSLEQADLDVTVVDGGDLDELAETDTSSTGLYVEIPEGLQSALEAGRPETVRVRTVMESFTMMGMADDAQVQAGLQIASQTIATDIVTEKAPDVPVQMMQQPLITDPSVTVGENTAAVDVGTVSGFIAQQTVFIPIVLFVVIMFASQLIAGAIATEKENKTLETLLSYPISRTALVTAKMFAAGLVSLLAAGAYLLGMQQYMSGIETGFAGGAQAAEGSQEVMRQLGLILGPADYLMLGLSLFAGILLALAIAIILGAFAENVKAVGALITPLMVLLMVPYMLTLFIDLETAAPAMRWGLLAVPFTHPFTAAQHLFFGDYTAVWIGIGYQMVWFVGFALIAARIFSSDRILTMKLDLRRKRGTTAA